VINSILSIGCILILGLFSGKWIKRIKLPTITAYIVLGIAIGPWGLNLVSGNVLGTSGLVSNIVLGFIAFSLGQNFSLTTFRIIGKSVFWISLCEACGAWILVTSVFYFLLHQPFYISLIFGAISSATAPAATMMVVREYKAKGSFTDTLLGVVALDDAWCLIIFAISLAVAKAANIHAALPVSIAPAIRNAAMHIVGAFGISALMAWILSYLSAYARNQTELLIYTLGFVFISIGLALHFGFSVLLSTMFLGAILVNINKVSFKFFDSIRTIDSPLYLVFFVLAGANLDIPILSSLGTFGLVYFIFRLLGKLSGASLGALIGGASRRVMKFIGFGLVPQAGVALGVALIVKDAFPRVGGIIFSTIVATTILYEIVGPLCTKLGLSKAGEI
jgi:Kef-type K+ transport system membrane component KefB